MKLIETRGEFLLQRLARHERTVYKHIETPFMRAVLKARSNG